MVLVKSLGGSMLSEALQPKERPSRQGWRSQGSGSMTGSLSFARVEPVVEVDTGYKRIRQDAERLNFGQTPKSSSVKMERLLNAVAAAIKVERAAGAVVETKRKPKRKPGVIRKRL